MNLEYLQFDLAEAHLHLTALLRELATGELGPDDNQVLAVNLLHITDHIHRAWNCRMMTEAELSAPSEEEFARLSNTVPNFHGTRLIGEDLF